MELLETYGGSSTTSTVATFPGYGEDDEYGGRPRRGRSSGEYTRLVGVDRRSGMYTVLEANDVCITYQVEATTTRIHWCFVGIRVTASTEKDGRWCVENKRFGPTLMHFLQYKLNTLRTMLSVITKHSDLSTSVSLSSLCVPVCDNNTLDWWRRGHGNMAGAVLVVVEFVPPSNYCGDVNALYRTVRKYMSNLRDSICTTYDFVYPSVNDYWYLAAWLKHIDETCIDENGLQSCFEQFHRIPGPPLHFAMYASWTESSSSILSTDIEVTSEASNIFDMYYCVCIDLTADGRSMTVVVFDDRGDVAVRLEAIPLDVGIVALCSDVLLPDNKSNWFLCANETTVMTLMLYVFDTGMSANMCHAFRIGLGGTLCFSSRCISLSPKLFTGTGNIFQSWPSYRLLYSTLCKEFNVPLDMFCEWKDHHLAEYIHVYETMRTFGVLLCKGSFSDVHLVTSTAAVGTLAEMKLHVPKRLYNMNVSIPAVYKPQGIFASIPGIYHVTLNDDSSTNTAMLLHFDVVSFGPSIAKWLRISPENCVMIQVSFENKSSLSQILYACLESNIEFSACEVIATDPPDILQRIFIKSGHDVLRHISHIAQGSPKLLVLIFHGRSEFLNTTFGRLYRCFPKQVAKGFVNTMIGLSNHSDVSFSNVFSSGIYYFILHYVGRKLIQNLLFGTPSLVADCQIILVTNDGFILQTRSAGSHAEVLRGTIANVTEGHLALQVRDLGKWAWVIDAHRWCSETCGAGSKDLKSRFSQLIDVHDDRAVFYGIRNYVRQQLDHGCTIDVIDKKLILHFLSCKTSSYRFDSWKVFLSKLND